MLAEGLDEEPTLELVHHLFERSLCGADTLDHAFDLANTRREQIRGDEAAGIDLNDEALHLVLKLAYVSGPIVALEELHRLLGESPRCFAELRCVTGEEVRGE